MEPQRLSLWRHVLGDDDGLIRALQWSHSAYRCGDNRSGRKPVKLQLASMEPQRLSLWRPMRAWSATTFATASMEPQRLSLWRHLVPDRTEIPAILLQWSHSAYRCGDWSTARSCGCYISLQWSHSAYRCGDGTLPHPSVDGELPGMPREPPHSRHASGNDRRCPGPSSPHESPSGKASRAAGELREPLRHVSSTPTSRGMRCDGFNCQRTQPSCMEETRRPWSHSPRTVEIEVGRNVSKNALLLQWSHSAQRCGDGLSQRSSDARHMWRHWRGPPRHVPATPGSRGGIRHVLRASSIKERSSSCSCTRLMGQAPARPHRRCHSPARYV